MPPFEEMFIQSQGRPVEYKGHLLFMMDTLALGKTGSRFRVVRESTDSEWPQDISLWTKKGKITVNGKTFESITLWEHAAPLEAEIEAASPDGKLRVKNVWATKDHRGTTVVQSWHHGAAMIIEELPNGKRYRCNDGDPDDDFNDIVFRIEHLG